VPAQTSIHESRGRSRPDAPCNGVVWNRIWLSLLVPLVFVVDVAGFPMLRASAEERPALTLPIDCRLGQDCFVQQMPDVDRGPGTLDPLCGQATYQRHTGWDFRLRSLADLAQDVPIVAVADGTVARVRDGVPDRIFDPETDRALVKDKECGNGLVIDHEGGLSSQYCHAKSGSLSVRAGARIRKGERIGSIGSSGLAQFPHVHLSIYQNGQLVEPLTGKALGSEAHACGDLSDSLFDAGAKIALVQSSTAILDFGLAVDPPELARLVRVGGPPLVTGRSKSIVAWVWGINVDEGSQFRIRTFGPNNAMLMDHTTTTLPRRKANYLAYVGRKTDVEAGPYSLTVEITNGGKQVISKTRSLTVAD
jgi:peptidase M23-like protein